MPFIFITCGKIIFVKFIVLKSTIRFPTIHIMHNYIDPVEDGCITLYGLLSFINKIILPISDIISCGVIVVTILTDQRATDSVKSMAAEDSKLSLEATSFSSGINMDSMSRHSFLYGYTSREVLIPRIQYF